MDAAVRQDNYVLSPLGTTKSGKMEKLDEKGQRALKLMADLQMQREESLQCDFEVRIDGKRFPVHRSVLAASSNYFNAMLKIDMKEASQGYVEMKGLEDTAVKACLDYLYSGEVEVNFDEIEPILRASDLMQIEDLKAMLFRHISNKISVDNCLQIHHYAMAYNSLDMRAYENFIARNFASVSKTEEFKLLDKTQLQECLKLFKELSENDINNTPAEERPKPAQRHGWHKRRVYVGLPRMNLTVSSTKTQWQAIANWVGQNHEERGEYLLELLQTIEPFDISSVFSCVLGDPLIATRQDCVEFIVKQAVLPNAQCIGNYISMENCFNLKRWAKQYNSNDLSIMVYNFMIKNFHAVVTSERIEEFDLEEFRNFLSDHRTKGFPEQPKYDAIIRWTGARQAERVQYFEDLFDILCLSRLPPDFIHNTVRKEPLVKSCLSCNEKIMDALYAHTKGPRRY